MILSFANRFHVAMQVRWKVMKAISAPSGVYWLRAAIGAAFASSQPPDQFEEGLRTLGGSPIL
jgi:hypothetical protein